MTIIYSRMVIMTVKKFLLYLRYSKKKPVDISAERWYAMCLQYHNNKEVFENE